MIMLMIWILTVISKIQYCEAETSNHWTNDFNQSKPLYSAFHFFFKYKATVLSTTISLNNA